MTSGLALAGTMSAIFCDALPLRRRRAQSLLRSSLKRVLAESIVVSYEPPSHEVRAQSEAIWDLFYQLLIARVTDKEQLGRRKSARLAAWWRLRRSLQGPLGGTAVVRFCYLGCHGSKEDAIFQITTDLTTLLLDHPPTHTSFQQLGGRSLRH